MDGRGPRDGHGGSLISLSGGRGRRDRGTDGRQGTEGMEGRQGTEGWTRYVADQSRWRQGSLRVGVPDCLAN